MGNLAEGEFGCQYCGGRGDLHWLVVHSHRRRGKTSRVMEALWRIGMAGRSRW